MADEIELEIKIIPDEEANVEAAQAADEKVIAKEEKPAKDPAIQKLMDDYKELEERAGKAERDRLAAEQEASRHRVEAENAKKQVASSHLDTVSTALGAAKADAEQAKRDIRLAKDAGDIDAEIEAQDRLAQARADERRLDEARSDLEARAKAPPKREERRADPVEDFVRGRTEMTANWLRAHPEFIMDGRKQNKLTAAHYDAEGEGLTADTPAYFAHVEKFLGIGGEERKAEPRTKPSAPVAPGGGGGSGGNGTGGTAVSLTKGEALSATDGTLVWNYPDPTGKNRWQVGEPIGLQEMARRKISGQKNGSYDRSMSDN